MLLNFPVMQAMYLSLARGDPAPVASALEAMPAKPVDSQWATFVRNHDELTLDQLSDDERQEVFAAFGPDEEMQLFGRGLRRRLPTMLEGDPRRIRMVYSLMLTLPGAPVLFYGEEIGMGENLAIEGRLSVRTPMQWRPTPSAGFSSASPSRLRRPLPDGAFGAMDVNVADQLDDDDSLLVWMARAIRRRRQTPEFGWGEMRLLRTGNDHVLGHACTWEDRTAVAFHNFSDRRQVVEAKVGAALADQTLLHLLGPDRRVPDLVDDRLEVTLEAHGYRWLRFDAAPNPLM
jgi:glycosidase